MDGIRALFRIIELKLELGIVRDELVGRIERIVRRRMQETGADALLLGCTEQSLVFSRISPSVLAIAPVVVHIGAIIGRIMAMDGRLKSVWSFQMSEILVAIC